MTDDRLSRQANRDAFDAIVSQVEDPERRYFRRLFLILGATLLAAAAVAFIAAGWGSPVVVAFSASYLPGMVAGERFFERRYTGRDQKWRRR